MMGPKVFKDVPRPNWILMDNLKVEWFKPYIVQYRIGKRGHIISFTFIALVEWILMEYNLKVEWLWLELVQVDLVWIKLM